MVPLRVVSTPKGTCMVMRSLALPFCITKDGYDATGRVCFFGWIGTTIIEDLNSLDGLYTTVAVEERSKLVWPPNAFMNSSSQNSQEQLFVGAWNFSTLFLTYYLIAGFIFYTNLTFIRLSVQMSMTNICRGVLYWSISYFFVLFNFFLKIFHKSKCLLCFNA